jgi:Ferritin-like
MPIATVEDLRGHLSLAVEVEMSTVPLYLFGLYSIVDQDSECAKLIRSVVTEEMLHVSLVSNLLLAVGSEPRFDLPSVLPGYPEPLKHHRPPLMLDLAPVSIDQIRDTYMTIERPEDHSAPPEADQYETLGQFYHAIELALHELSAKGPLFDRPQMHRQMAEPAFYAPVAYDADDSGGLIGIDDLESACGAIDIMIHQGEGVSLDRWADASHQELTHYHKYKLLVEGAIPLGEIHPCMTNPKRDLLPATLHDPVDLFNASYRHLLLTMNDIFSGEADQNALIGVLYHVMVRLLRPLGRFLAAQPIGEGLTAGPTFELYEFGSSPRVPQLVELADRSATAFPELADVADDVRALPED